MDKDEIDLIETWLAKRREILPTLGVEPELGPRAAGEAQAIAQSLVHSRYALPAEELCEILRFACSHRFHGGKVLASLAYFKAYQADITADYRAQRDKAPAMAGSQRQGQKLWYTPRDDPSWYED